MATTKEQARHVFHGAKHYVMEFGAAAVLPTIVAFTQGEAISATTGLYMTGLEAGMEFALHDPEGARAFVDAIAVERADSEATLADPLNKAGYDELMAQLGKVARGTYEFECAGQGEAIH